MATPAKACRKALTDATERWPKRNRASDGIMGDAAHAARKSDHNSGDAFDLTNDPVHGPDCDVLSRQVINDPRVTYVIWEGRIYKRREPQKGWQKYTGSNQHNHHMHVSIKTTTRDDLSPWPWTVAKGERVLVPTETRTTIPEPEAQSQPAAPAKDDGTQTNKEVSGAVAEPAAKQVKIANMSPTTKAISFTMIGSAALKFIQEMWQSSQQTVVSAGQFALAHLPQTLLIIGLAALGVWIYNQSSKRAAARTAQIVEITSNQDKDDVIIT